MVESVEPPSDQTGEPLDSITRLAAAAEEKGRLLQVRIEQERKAQKQEAERQRLQSQQLASDAQLIAQINKLTGEVQDLSGLLCARIEADAGALERAQILHQLEILTVCVREMTMAFLATRRDLADDTAIELRGIQDRLMAVLQRAVAREPLIVEQQAGGVRIGDEADIRAGSIVGRDSEQNGG